MNSISQDVAVVSGIAAVPTILDIVCRSTGMGFAAVARVTEEQWVACAVKDDIGFGLKPGGELKLETTICHEIRQSGAGVIIDHVAEDPAFRGHHTPAMYGFQSYISLPIVRQDGSFFGTLCAIDPRPARLQTPEVVGMFRMFAELISFHLEAHERLARTEAALSDEREVAELREQFIAVLGHDLRNPLGSIAASALVLDATPLDARQKRSIGLIQRSVARMAGLIDNVLDFARGRLGHGLSLELRSEEALAPTLEHVVAELAAIHPGRAIDAAFDLSQPVPCDRDKLGQLLSNLLANALTHGDADGVVRVSAATQGGRFELTVANPGPPLEETVRKQLFHPFQRSRTPGGQQGLGLGLYIAAEIARAHGGTLSADSAGGQTRFTFAMPLQAAGA